MGNSQPHRFISGRFLAVLCAVCGVFAAFALSGCGMQPSGAGEGTVKAKEAGLEPQKQIELIQNGPIPYAAKQQKIAEIKAKYGLK